VRLASDAADDRAYAASKSDREVGRRYGGGVFALGAVGAIAQDPGKLRDGQPAARQVEFTGHVVYATARREDAIADLRQAGARTLVLDVTDEASMSAAVQRVVDEHGAVGVLVNNAGYSQSGALETLPMGDLRRQFETNVFGLVRMCQLVLPGMREQRWGRIINISSMGGNFTFPGGGAYHGSKYALEALSDALRFEVKGFGIDVVIVQPGLIHTEFGATAVGELSTGDGPYTHFNASVARATEEIYASGPLARLGGGPDQKARNPDDETSPPGNKPSNIHASLVGRADTQSRPAGNLWMNARL
jgi:NAD(P)-dependent dehydrogenase (short-subunit alcohol dehydrogenase family)